MVVENSKKYWCFLSSKHFGDNQWFLSNHANVFDWFC